MQRLMEYLIEIWRQSDSMETFIGNLYKLGQVDPYSFCSLVFLSSEDSITSFNKRLQFSFGSKIEEEKSNSTLYYLCTFVGRKQEKIEGRVILFQEKPGISFIFTISSRDFINKCLLRFLARSYPIIFQPIFRQDKLKGILRNIEKHLLPNRIRITKTSAKRWTISEDTAGKKKRICSRLDWENVSVKDAFREAAEEGKWFTKLTFKIYTLKESSFQDTNLEGVISKRGMFLTNKWLTQYSEIIIPSFLSLAEEKMKLYRNRSRADTISHEIHPLVIRFEENIFADRKNNEEFITILKKIPHFGYSVIHANPYIHMSLLDYRDGSSFEILIHEPDRILILPQIRASAISLEQIIGQIVEKFSEGEVVDLKDIQ